MSLNWILQRLNPGIAGSCRDGGISEGGKGNEAPFFVGGVFLFVWPLENSGHNVVATADSVEFNNGFSLPNSEDVCYGVICAVLSSTLLSFSFGTPTNRDTTSLADCLRHSYLPIVPRRLEGGLKESIGFSGQLPCAIRWALRAFLWLFGLEATLFIMQLFVGTIGLFSLLILNSIVPLHFACCDSIAKVALLCDLYSDHVLCMFFFTRYR